MDKRTVYGRLGERHTGGKDTSTFECGLTERNDLCMASPCRGCVEQVLVNPADLAKLEAQTARVPELEKENERLKNLCGKSQGLYDALVELCEATNQFCESFCDKLKSDGTCDPDDCVVWIAQDKARAHLACYKCFKDAPSGIVCPMVDSEEEFRKAREYARIGRAVEEWANREFVVMGEGVDPVQGAIAFSRCLAELREVIAKAREDEKNA